jgi:GNAT superfamily N-acetyltransferase
MDIIGFMQTDDLIQHAVQAFVRGFCFTRSLPHPYLPEQAGPLWVMRDAPRRSGSYRNEEWVMYGLSPGETERIVREHSRGRYSISVICGLQDSEEPLRAGFKALGYRLKTTEPLMIHRLAHIPVLDAPAVIERVQTQEQAERLARANHKRQVLPEHFLPGSPLRQYMALVGDAVVGWVCSISAGDASWCSDMFVDPAFRRRGIARAMLGRMLADDRAAGVRTAVLLASHTGARLYPVVGYEQIGTLLAFFPRKQQD